MTEYTVANSWAQKVASNIEEEIPQGERFLLAVFSSCCQRKW